jgi:hypothetical protein
VSLLDSEQIQAICVGVRHERTIITVIVVVKMGEIDLAERGL